MYRMLLTLGILVVFAGPATAQLEDASPPGPRPAFTVGQRLRITMRSAGNDPASRRVRVEGRFEERTDDGLRLTIEPGLHQREMEVPDARILGIEVARPGTRADGARRGALLGAVIGAGFGAIGMGMMASEDPAFFDVGSGDVVAAAALFGAVGAGVGALIGSTHQGTQWVPVAAR